MQYKDAISNKLQAPFKKAFNLGKKYNSEGETAGAGNILSDKITTTTNTNMDTPATKRNTNLSEKFINQELLFYVILRLSAL
jgi:hypothetical protein